MSVGCATVDPAKPSTHPSATVADASGKQRGVSPQPSVVPNSRDRQASVATDTDSAPADPSTDKQAADKAAAAKAKLSPSDLRKQRLREVADDFDRRRDEAQYQAARTRWLEDDGTGCRASLEQILKRNPNHCPARLLLAEVALAEGHTKEALDQARQVMGLDAASAGAHHIMALALDALGESPAALMHYEAAARLDPQNEQYAACYQAALNTTIPPGSQNLDAAGATASLAESTDDADFATLVEQSDRTGTAGQSGRAGAAQHATQTSTETASDPRTQDAAHALAAAVSALRQDRPQEAATLAEAGLKHDPNSAPLHRALGAARYQEGDFLAAQTALERAISLDKSDALAYFLMGSTLSRLGDSDAAQRQFANAARLDPRYGSPRD